MKDLFICSAGKRRSPRAASIARKLALDSGIGDYQADHSGTDFIVKNPNFLNNYDRVFVMDNLITRELFVCSSAGKMFKGEIIVLGVGDVNAALFYTVGETKLMEMLEAEIEEKLKPYFRRK